MTAPCPLCGRKDGSEVVSTTTFQSIWMDLERALGEPFPPTLKDPLSPTGSTSLFSCPDCQLLFFDPAVAGDQAFYAALARNPAYYVAIRWEMDQILRRLPQGSRVLDFGCGSGAFLKLAAARGATVFGVDLSPSARQELNEAGIPNSATLDEVTGVPLFDTAVVLQTLEHLSDPLVFKDLVSLVKPGGLIHIAVPNPKRLEKGTETGLDYPPHHLTRWTPKALESLAGRCNATLIELRYEPLPPRRLVRALARRWGRAHSPTSPEELFMEAPPSWLKFRYWRLATPLIGRRLPAYGHSMLATFRTPQHAPKS